jgi:hypothetical protein
MWAEMGIYRCFLGRQNRLAEQCLVVQEFFDADKKQIVGCTKFVLHLGCS